MHNFFIEKHQVKEKVEIIGSDVNHIKNVLRLKVNDKICVHVKEEKSKYICEIIDISDKILCNILEVLEIDNETEIYINIIQGLPKSDKMELIIQKCTELGVKEFTPLNLNRCIVKLTGKDEIKKIDRWQSIAEVAAKQAGRDLIPKINSVYNINNIQNLLNDYDLVLVAYEDEHNNSLKYELSKINNTVKKLAIIIGPEGGIESQEIEKLKSYNYNVVSLGNRILRTETVGISLSSIILYIFGDLGGK